MPKSVPCGLEGDLDGATSCPETSSDSNTKTTSSSITTAATTTASATTRLAVLADLLADLPAPERREVIASLPPTDRVAIARLIAGAAIV